MTDTQLNATFAALADPTRRAILDRLCEGEATVAELMAPHSMTPSAITKHIKVLESAGLLTQRRHRQFRPCSLNPEPLKQAIEWISDRQAFWNAQFDQLDGFLNDTKMPPASS